MAKAQVFSLPKRPNESPLFHINAFKGINLSTIPTQIDENHSPDMLNLNVGERGALTKRTGYEKLFELGTDTINGMYVYLDEDKQKTLLMASGTKLYEIKVNEIGTATPTLVYDGAADSRVTFFEMNQKVYILDGTNFLVYQPSNPVGNDRVIPIYGGYIPTVTISRTPSGGGEPYEDLNLIEPGFKDSFSADGVATDYQLSQKNLDAIGIKATVNGANIEETLGLTVDHTTGIVTFPTPPAAGTNNVIITAYKTNTGFVERIRKCRFSVLFGGTNDTRVFVSGNPDSPNQIWVSGLNDPTYWPENSFYKVGRENEAVQGFAKQYDYLVIEKEYSKWNMQFQLLDGKASFPIKPINDEVGTLARWSMQNIENTPVSLTQSGVYLLKASNIRDERNVEKISGNVDAQLLKEANLEQAISVDHDNQYWLALNQKVYLYDYLIKEWFIYDNIDATAFLEFEGTLYFGNGSGNVYRFKTKNHLTPYNDDGQPINVYWYSKLIDFGAPERYKLIQRIFHTLNPDTHTSSKLSIRTDKKGETFVTELRADQIDFQFFDFTRFAFSTSDLPQQSAKKIKEKKITHLQLKFENNVVDESFQLMGIGIKYAYQNEVK